MPPPAADSHAHLRADAIAALTAYRPASPVQERLRADYLDQLRAHPDATAKAGPPAHLTASCLVLDASRRHVLLTLHRRARRWFQFGGHLEPGDASLWAAAAREGREESGIAAVTPAPGIVHLDRHLLAGDFGRCREHLDVRYAALVPDGTTPEVSPESLAVRWWPVDALPEVSPGELTELVHAATAALR